jgi:hypothetical protein
VRHADANSISLIEIMGLIGENCVPCQAAAEDPEGGGLAGSWWRFWASVSDSSLAPKRAEPRSCRQTTSPGTSAPPSLGFLRRFYWGITSVGGAIASWLREEGEL